MNIFDLSSNTFRNLQLFNRQKSTSGLTQVEMLVTLILLGILLTIALSVYHRFMAWIRLNIATFEISQQWKNTRYQATGGGSHPISLCMAASETIYRASWGDTREGLGGSWGQLGRITLVAAGTPDKRCLFLFRVDGSWDIRQDNRCVP